MNSPSKKRNLEEVEIPDLTRDYASNYMVNSCTRPAHSKGIKLQKDETTLSESLMSKLASTKD